MYKRYGCDNCDADFKIKNNLTDEVYEVYYCPFCGGEIEDETDEDEHDDE